MANINDCLARILSAVYGKDVRQAIYDSIYQCYRDGRAGAVDLIAREQLEELAASVASNGLVASSHEFTTMDAIDALIASTVLTMSIGTVKVLDIQGYGRIVIHLTMGKDGVSYAVAELLTISSRSFLASFADGNRRVKRGCTDGGSHALADSWYWDEWEWDTPPMAADGTEYRTTERYNNMPVYTRLIRFDDIGGNANTIFQKSFAMPTPPAVVSLSCITTDMYYGYKPYPGSDSANSNRVSIAAYYEDGALTVGGQTLVTHADGTKAEVVIKYTKYSM